MKDKVIRLSATCLIERLHPLNLVTLMRSRFDDINLNTHRGQQNIVVIFGFVLVFLLVGTVALSSMEFATNKSSDPVYENFDQNDAELVCGNHIEKVVGPSLLRYYVDDHSSRLDLRKGLWRIYMVADIGAQGHFDEVNVHCFVNHYQHNLTHFRQINHARKTTLSTDLKFFSN